MKICVITAATWTVRKFRIDMIDEFVRRCCDVVVLGDEGEADWNGYFADHGVRYRSYFVTRNGMNPAGDLKTLKSLKRILQEERPDKVFTYQIKPNIYGGIAAHATGIADIYMMMGGIGSIFLAKGMKQTALRRVVSLEYRCAMRYAKRIFFQNHEDANVFVGLGITSQEKVVYTSGSGVNTGMFAPTPLPESPSFIFIGRAIRDKGAVEYLLASRALKRQHPEATCHFVGGVDSNPSSLRMEDIEPFIGDGSIVWHGWQDDVRPYISKASVFVLPSYREGTPKAALEAMAMGRAIVTTDAPGCREVVRRGVNGLLVAPGDADCLTAAMSTLADDPQLVKNMGTASRAIAESKFDVKAVNAVICETMGIR